VKLQPPQNSHWTDSLRFEIDIKNRQFTRAATIVLLLLLFLAPMAFGAVQVWAWATITVLVVAALNLWVLAAVMRLELKIFWNPIFLPIILFLTLTIFQYITKRTADSIGTREAIFKLVTDIILFFLVSQLFSASSKREWNALGLAVAIYTSSLALFAILQFFSDPVQIYWSIQPSQGGYIFGPYVNHNHYAGLMEMLIPLTGGFLLPLARTRERTVLIGFGLIIAVVSVLICGSRGGVVSLAVESVIVGTILFSKYGYSNGRRLPALYFAAIAVILILFIWIVPDGIVARLATITNPTEITYEDRDKMALDSLHMYLKHPWLGYGIGSFAAIYPQYQSFPTDHYIDHAHNDYLELLAETGTAGGLLMAVSLGLFFIQGFRALRFRLRHEIGWIQLGAAVGCCGILVHSCVDFNLHIPANAAWFSALLAIATCCVHPETG